MDWIANSSVGKKRPPNTDGDDDLITEQPLSKKLAKLSLHMEEQSRNRRDQQQRSRSTPSNERMEVDHDNSSVIFIHDIDEELESEDDDNSKRGLVFLPDIEKRLTRIPYALANEGGGKVSEPLPAPSQALVLYTVPSSLSVSRGQDSVRRAIIEARERIRQKQVDGSRQQYLVEARELVDNDGAGFGLEEDPDAMDIE